MIAILAASLLFSFTVPVQDDSSSSCTAQKFVAARGESLTVSWVAQPKVGKRFAAPMASGVARYRRGEQPQVRAIVDSTGRWFLLRAWPSKPGISTPSCRVRSIVLKAR